MDKGILRCRPLGTAALSATACIVLCLVMRDVPPMLRIVRRDDDRSRDRFDDAARVPSTNGGHLIRQYGAGIKLTSREGVGAHE
jgi:hypothetical protein